MAELFDKYNKTKQKLRTTLKQQSSCYLKLTSQIEKFIEQDSSKTSSTTDTNTTTASFTEDDDEEEVEQEIARKSSARPSDAKQSYESHKIENQLREIEECLSLGTTLESEDSLKVLCSTNQYLEALKYKAQSIEYNIHNLRRHIKDIEYRAFIDNNNNNNNEADGDSDMHGHYDHCPILVVDKTFAIVQYNTIFGELLQLPVNQRRVNKNNNNNNSHTLYSLLEHHEMSLVKQFLSEQYSSTSSSPFSPPFFIVNSILKDHNNGDTLLSFKIILMRSCMGADYDRLYIIVILAKEEEDASILLPSSS